MPPSKDEKRFRRHQRFWRFGYRLIHPWLCRKFRLTHGDLQVEGPVVLISNHVTAWDPLLTAMSLKHKQVYFVASEHIFRMGLVTRLINWLVEPIPRKKGTTGTDTAWACLRHLRAGRSVCIFAEGEQCWDGISQAIVPSTGKLVRISGACLVTFRIEGGYLSCPRWGRGVRRGRIRCHPVHIYSPEQLKSMTPLEIDQAINRDIAEDAWQRQEAEPVAYRGRRLAEGMERMLYLCPACGRIGGLKTRGDRIFCACGGSWQYTRQGFFSPETPFRHLAEWDRWEREKLRSREFPHGQMLFSDPGVGLTVIGQDHRETALGVGELRLYEDRLEWEDRVFPLAELSDMAAVLAKRLLFTFREDYCELLAGDGVNLRKYYEFWGVR